MRRTILSFALCCLFNILFSQFKVDYKHYSTGDGLSHGSVVSMMKDSQGFMWFSTWDGLDRFDGVNFKTFKTTPGDSLNLSSNRITEILEDKSNAIWLLTYDSRIFRLNLETEKFDDDVNQINNYLRGSIKQVFLSTRNDLWLATEKDGIFRIITKSSDNSIIINQYNTESEGSFHIETNKIHSVFEDPGQNIWFTSENGIFLLSGSDDFSKVDLNSDAQKILNKHSYTCHDILNDEIILGSKDGHIFRFYIEGQTIDSIHLCKNPITTIHTNINRIYAGTEGDGLFALSYPDLKKEHNYYNENLISVFQIYEDSFGLIWLETNVDGVVKVDTKTRDIKNFVQKVDVKNVRHVISRCHFTEAAGTLWMSIKGGGFGYYNRTRDSFDYFYNAPGSPQNKMSNFVYCFHIDENKVLWVNTYRKGIEKFTLLDRHFNFVSPNPGSKNFLSNEVRALYEDTSGILWLATKSGDIYLMDDDYNVISDFSKENELPPILVYSITEDKDGTIWLGTKGDGIFKVNRNGKNAWRIKQYRHEVNNTHSLSNDKVYHIEEDADKSLWIATYGGGLNRLEFINDQAVFRNSTLHYQGYPENSCNRIRQVKKDSKGNLWLATTEGLVFCKVEGQKGEITEFQRYTKVPGDDHSLGNNDVYCIFEDKEDTLWFGTLGGGLQKLLHYPSPDQPASFEVYTREDGLSSDVILTIEGDENNNLWMSSENGLIKYNSKEHLIRNYDRHDGIDVASFSEATSTYRRNGDLVFGTYDGLCYFKPEKIVEKPRKTSIFFTGLKVLNEVIDVKNDNGILLKSPLFTDALEFSYKQNVFELSFTALDFRTVPGIQYQYKLEGFDEQWRLSENGNVSYSKVPPGKYTFNIELQNPDIILDEPFALEIIVRKPFWKTGLAYLVYILLILLLVLFGAQILISMVRLRNKIVVEKQISEVKMNFFTNISHELRTPLTLIQGPVQEISRKEKLSEKGKEYLELINRNSEKMLRLVNQLLDFRKIQNNKMRLSLELVNLNTFVSEICDAFRNEAREKKIHFSCIQRKKNVVVWIDREKIESVLYNLISNAFKFTPGGNKVILELDKKGPSVILSVHDQGIGIKDSKKELVFQSFVNIQEPSEMNKMSTGLGLSLAKEFIELHKGSINFNSKEGAGTTFNIHLKTGRDHFDEDSVSYIEEERDSLRYRKRIKSRVNTVETPIYDIDQPPEKKNKEDLLLVEDNREVRVFLRDIFSDDFTLHEAENGAEGAEKALRIQPQMIIADIMMPEMDGIEMLIRLREDFSTSHIPVILLTSKSSIESRIEGIRYGADAYVSKPFNSIHLKTLVDNLIKQRKRLISKYSGSISIRDIAEEELVVTDKDGDFLKQVFDIIEENLSDSRFKISVLSRSLGMGKTYFFDKVKGLTGLSPIDLIKEYRLGKASEFLRSGKYSVAEVSFKAGFHDPGYFSRCFKEKFGKTPSQFMKEDSI